MTPPTPEAAGVDVEALRGHSPGPWEFVPAGSLKPAFQLGKFSDFAVYAPGNAFPWRMAEVVAPSEEMAEANARLIAAAPALLAEVERLRAVNAELVAACRDGLRECHGGHFGLATTCTIAPCPTLRAALTNARRTGG